MGPDYEPEHNDDVQRCDSREMKEENILPAAEDNLARIHGKQAILMSLFEKSPRVAEMSFFGQQSTDYFLLHTCQR